MNKINYKTNTIDTKTIEPNSIVVVNVDVDTNVDKLKFIPTFEKLFSPYAKDFKEKNIMVVIMKNGESLEVLPEKQMNDAGWFKLGKVIST